MTTQAFDLFNHRCSSPFLTKNQYHKFDMIRAGVDIYSVGVVVDHPRNKNIIAQFLTNSIDIYEQ